MPTFGSRKNNEKTGSGSGNFEMFIKNFKEPQSRIAILDPDPNLWVKYLQHFDNGAKIGFPCAKFEGVEACIGCDYPVEHEEYEDLDAHFPDGTYSEKIQARKKADPGWAVRDAAPKWAVPVIDPKGYVSIFQFGVGLRDDFITQHKVLGTITANEWVVTREGSGFNTSYGLVAMPGEVRKPKAAVPTENDISAILGKKYVEAMEKYGMEIPDETGFAEETAPDPAPVTDTAVDPANIASQPQAPTLPAKPDTGAKAEPVPGDSQLHGFAPREAGTGEIKDWLTEAGVEFPPKAARQVLVALAEKTITERQVANF